MKHVVSRGGGSEEITLSFINVFRESTLSPYSRKNSESLLELEVDFIIGEVGDNIPYVKSIFAKFRSFNIELHFGESRVIKVVSGEYDFSEYFKEIFSFDDGRFFPLLYERNEGLIQKARGNYRRLIEITKYLVSASLPRALDAEVNKIVKGYQRKNASELRTYASVNALHEMALSGVNFEELSGSTPHRDSAVEKMKRLFIDGKNDDFKRLIHISAIKHSFSILENFNNNIDLTARNIRYRAPLRATASRPT